MPVSDMGDLFNSLHIGVAPGLDPNVNNIVAATTFFSQAGATLCLVRVETDPSDRTQMRLTVASQDPNVTYEVKEFIKEQVIDIPFARTPAPTPSPAVMGLTGPAAALAGLI
jgi:AP-2 complex subunit alpha